MGHLAYTLADSIYRMQRDELDITRSDVKCAEVAGADLSKNNGSRLLSLHAPTLHQMTEKALLAARPSTCTDMAQAARQQSAKQIEIGFLREPWHYRTPFCCRFGA